VARSRKNEAREDNPELVDHQDRDRLSWGEDGTLVLTLRIAPERAPLVIAALEQAQQDAQCERESRAREHAARGDVSAEDLAVAALAAFVPYLFVEPFYAVDGTVAERRVWTEEVSGRRERRDASRAERERLEADVRALGLPTGKATLADGLFHALTHGLSKAPKVEVLIDPVSGWAHTTADELLPPAPSRRSCAPSRVGRPCRAPGRSPRPT
jgi:hypothetical protein